MHSKFHSLSVQYNTQASPRNRYGTHSSTAQSIYAFHMHIHVFGTSVFLALDEQTTFKRLDKIRNAL